MNEVRFIHPCMKCGSEMTLIDLWLDGTRRISLDFTCEHCGHELNLYRQTPQELYQQALGKFPGH